jgi:hypothetical protein
MTYSDTYVGKLVLTLRAAEDERDAALARCERLQEALKPFAHEAWRHAPDDQPIAFTLGACRRAREALEQP